MKKITALMFAFLMSVTFAVAQTANTDVKKVTMTDTAVTTDGEEDTEIEYNGIIVSIPKGVKATVSTNAEGQIVLSGSDLAGVKVDQHTINSAGNTTISLNPETKAITVQQGSDVQVTNPQGETSTVQAGQTVAPAAPAATDAPAAAESTEATPAAPTANVPAFVLPSTESAANQQASENVEQALSPSAPR